MQPCTTTLFDIWSFLDEALSRELEDLECCRKVAVLPPEASRIKIQIYRGLLKKFETIDFDLF